MSHLTNLQHQLVEQQKIIDYLRDQYKNQTGHDANIPQQLSQFLNVQTSNAPILQSEEELKQYQIELENKEQTFLQALLQLGLPQKISGEQKKKGKLNMQTTFDPSNPNHMIEVINLSNFAFKQFTKSGLKELLESIVDMRCLNTIILQNNGIDDTYIDELTCLFNLANVKKINLQRNNIGKQGCLQIANLLKSSVSQIEYLDLSRNLFSNNETVVSHLIQGLKKQNNLYHLCLDVNTQDVNQNKNYSMSENVTRLLFQNNSLSSLSIIDSKITKNAMLNIQNALENDKMHVTALNFQYCFLNLEQIFSLKKALFKNKTLIKLDLSHNALDSISGIHIVKNLKDNISLAHLNLSHNHLKNPFAFELADCLKINQILFEVDISFNPIGVEGAEALIKVLHEDNEYLESLGDIQGINCEMGAVNIQILKRCLKTNQVSKDVRSRLLASRKNRKGDNPTELNINMSEFDKDKMEIEQEFDDYIICKPIIFTNDPYQDPSYFELWNI